MTTKSEEDVAREWLAKWASDITRKMYWKGLVCEDAEQALAALIREQKRELLRECVATLIRGTGRITNLSQAVDSIQALNSPPEDTHG